MAEYATGSARRMSPEFWAIIGVGITLFGQAVLQDNRVNDRIDKLDEKPSGEIRALEGKVKSINKRLAVVESHVLGVPSIAPFDQEDESTSP